MLDFVLITVMAAVVTFGWFLMRKLDNALEHVRQEEAALDSGRKNALRIGLSDPLVADSLSDALEQQAKVTVSLFSGTETELLKSFRAHRLDMVFLPEDAPVPEQLLDYVKEVSLEHSPVLLRHGGMQIEPITKGHIHQKIIWAERELPPAAGQLIQYLQHDHSALDAHTMR